MPQVRRSKSSLSPQRVRELKTLAVRIDREESREISAKARAHRLDAIRLAEVFRQLHAERQRQDLSLAEISRRSGIDRARLSRLETAKHPNVTTETLDRYAQALHKQIVVSLADAG